MNRRGFLGAMLGAMAAPAVVKAENLMKIFVPPEPKILTLSGLPADFYGDVHFSHMRDGLERWRARLERNGQFGAEVSYPRGESPYFAHIDEAAFYPPKGADRDYFTAWAESNGNLGQTAHRLMTLRRGGQPSKNQLGLQLPVGRIRPQLIRVKA